MHRNTAHRLKFKFCISYQFFTQNKCLQEWTQTKVFNQPRLMTCFYGGSQKPTGLKIQYSACYISFGVPTEFPPALANLRGESFSLMRKISTKHFRVWEQNTRRKPAIKWAHILQTDIIIAVDRLTAFWKTYHNCILSWNNGLHSVYGYILSTILCLNMRATSSVWFTRTFKF